MDDGNEDDREDQERGNQSKNLCGTYRLDNWRARNLRYFGSKCYHGFSFATGILMW